MIDFLKPTKQKILGTFIILIALFIGSYISEEITYLVPSGDIPIEKLEDFFKETFENNFDETLKFGLQLMAIEIGINIIMVYLGMCLIFRKKKKI